MWLWSVVACATLFLDPARSNAGLSSTSFSNELRTGFARLFQNGVEQPVQPPFVVLDPGQDVSINGNPLLQPRPAFGPFTQTGYQVPRPRYELRQRLSWAIPYYFIPTRYHPHRGKRPNDVLVVVIKSNCTAANETNSADDPDDDDDDNDGPPIPDDDAEDVTVVSGGAENGKEPSRCVWAVLACCAPSNAPVRYTCFDVLGCSTAFWDTDPCVPAVVRAALDQAAKYYGPAVAVDRATTPAAPPATAPPSTAAAADPSSSPAAPAAVVADTTTAAAAPAAA